MEQYLKKDITVYAEKYVKVGSEMRKLDNERENICPAQVSNCFLYRRNVNNDLLENTDFNQTTDNNTFDVPSSSTENKDWKSRTGNSPEFGHDFKDINYEYGTRNACTINGQIVGIPGKFGMDKPCRFRR